MPLRQQDTTSQSQANIDWTLSRSFTCLHSPPPPLRKETQSTPDEFLEDERDQQHRPLSPPLTRLPSSPSPVPTLRPRETGECPHRGSCRLFGAIPASFPTTSPLHRTNPPYIPRQHVQLDEQPVSLKSSLFAISCLDSRSGYPCCSWHWQLRLVVYALLSPCLLSLPNRESGYRRYRVHHLLGIIGHTNATIQASNSTTRTHRPLCWDIPNNPRLNQAKCHLAILPPGYPPDIKPWTNLGNLGSWMIYPLPN